MCAVGSYGAVGHNERHRRPGRPELHFEGGGDVEPRRHRQTVDRGNILCLVVHELPSAGRAGSATCGGWVAGCKWFQQWSLAGSGSYRDTTHRWRKRRPQPRHRVTRQMQEWQSSSPQRGSCGHDLESARTFSMDSADDWQPGASSTRNPRGECDGPGRSPRRAFPDPRQEPG